MSKVNSYETDTLELVFNNTPLADIGDSSGLQPSSVAGNFYVALFTADPTEAGLVTAEADYTGYTRVAVARTSGGWTIASGVASNTAPTVFGTATAGSNLITHFAVCTDGTPGNSTVIYYGTLNSSLAVSSGITPEFAVGTLTVTED